MIRLTRSVIFLILFGLSAASHAAAFIFVAHSDDATLFMARNAASSIQTGAKVVFVVVTAGDGGLRTAPYFPGKQPYYKTRQAGFVANLRSWYELQNKGPYMDSYQRVSIAGKPMQRTLIEGIGSNVVLYNLALPDSCDASHKRADGTCIGDLSDLLRNPTAPITSLDPTQSGDLTNGNSFTLAQLKAFVNGVIAMEQDGNDTWVNIPEHDTQYTPFDNPEHEATSKIVTAALQDYAAGNPSGRCVRSIQFIGYFPGNCAPSGEVVTCINPKDPSNWVYTMKQRDSVCDTVQQPNVFPVNYTSDEQTVQCRAWNAYNDAMVSAGGPDTRPTDYSNIQDPIGHGKWLYRGYYSPNGVTKFGACP